MIDPYAEFGRRLSSAGDQRAAVEEALRPLMCNPRGAGGFLADRVRRSIGSWMATPALASGFAIPRALLASRLTSSPASTT
jgi:hypothetical protein